MSKIHKAKQQLFQDNTGKYVLGQAPNTLIYIMAVGFVGQLFSKGAVNTFFDLLFFGAAFAWGYLEIRYGESNFRRILGGVIIVLIFASRLS
jgi:hypothetical protein